MHALDHDAALEDDQEGGDQLADELLDGRNDQDVVLQTEEEDHQCGSEEILEFGGGIDPDRDKAGHDETCEDPQAPERRDGGQVHFALVGDVEKLFCIGYLYDDRYGGKSYDEGYGGAK